MAEDLKIRGGVRPLPPASAIPGFQTKLMKTHQFGTISGSFTCNLFYEIQRPNYSNVKKLTNKSSIQLSSFMVFMTASFAFMVLGSMNIFVELSQNFPRDQIQMKVQVLDFYHHA